MKVQILQENLLKTLNRTTRIISTKVQLPILQNILLKTEDGMLRVSATNMETSISSLVRAKEEKSGGLCVPAKLFAELVSTLPAETITLEEKDGSLAVTGTKTHALLPSLPMSEYPPIDSGGEKNIETMEKEFFMESLSGILFAAATDEGRPILTGVKIHQKDGEMVLAATDGYRLSVKKASFAGKGERDVVLPARALGEVLRIVSEEKDAKKISLGFIAESQAVVSIGDVKITCRTLDGEYPPYEKIIPKAHTTEVTLDVDMFLRAVKSASIFARDNANIIKLRLGKGGLVVSANTPQVGQNMVEVDAQVVGEDAEIAFNSRFLTEFLTNFKEDQIVFQMTGSLNPGLFKPVKDPTYLHIIMPVRVQS